jgi:Ca2+-transporting ATPase
MGKRGTDVAREASSIVLLEDDFNSIVAAVRLGRRIYDNLRKAMSFIFAVHLPIAGMALLPLVTGLPVIFAPIHIAFLEMVIDPVCSLVFEAETEEDDIMERAPRDPDEDLFTSNMVVRALMQGLLAFVLVAGVYFWGLDLGLPAEGVRALTFLTLVLVIVSLIFANRSFSTSLRKALSRPNPALGWVLLLVGGTLSLALFWPFMRDIFRFGPVEPVHILVTIGVALFSLIVAEQLKRFLRTLGKAGQAS